MQPPHTKQEHSVTASEVLTLNADSTTPGSDQPPVLRVNGFVDEFKRRIEAQSAARGPAAAVSQ